MTVQLPRRLAVTARLASAFVIAATFAFGSPATAQQTATPAAPTLPGSAEAWSAAAQRDVRAAYQVFADNHPGMFNPQDPGFPAQLRAARDRGLQLAARVRDGAGYAAALQGFNTGLRDGHALVFATLPAGATTPRWPGFVAVWRGESLKVLASSELAAAAGATILDCDGRDASTLMRDDVFAFGGRPDEAGQWWMLGSDVFRDDGNPFRTIPRRCRFAASGKVAELALVWRPVDDQHQAWRRAARGEVLPPGLSQPGPKLFWLALPTFTPDENQRATYRDAFDALLRRRSEILAADAVVIDLRGNQGGSSAWSQDAAVALWGEKPVHAVVDTDPSRVVWRASASNTRYVVALVDRLRAEGQAEAATDVERTAAGMTAALARGEPNWQELATPSARPAVEAPDLPPLTTPVYVIVPGQCASACLDALDLFTRFPNTRLVGAPSSGDTVYMDVRGEPLPGGLAKVVIPNKVYRDRPRASGQVYPPDILVDDLAWSTAAFLAAIARDLRSPPGAPRH